MNCGRFGREEGRGYKTARLLRESRCQMNTGRMERIRKVEIISFDVRILVVSMVLTWERHLMRVEARLSRGTASSAMPLKTPYNHT
jgi:hypothetical protein